MAIGHGAMDAGPRRILEVLTGTTDPDALLRDVVASALEVERWLVVEGSVREALEARRILALRIARAADELARSLTAH